MSDGQPRGPRPFWFTREGVVLAVVIVVVIGLALWGISGVLRDAFTPAPKQQPPTKTKPDQPRPQPQPKLPNPDANP
jgi:hypothetical protein